MRIKERQDEIDHVDFMPWIYIDAKKKFPVYGNISQDINRKGVGMTSGKLGLRSPFMMYDKLEFNCEFPWNQLSRKYYQIGLIWQNPIKKYGDFYCGLNFSNNSIYTDIHEASKSINVGINNDKYRI